MIFNSEVQQESIAADEGKTKNLLINTHWRF